MNLLVRLYPRAWQERYGDELAAILEDRPPGPFDVADLALGALDAHLQMRRSGHRSGHQRGIRMSLRLAGLAAAVGGALWALFFIMAGNAYANGADYGLAWVLLVLVAGLVLLAALAGLSAAQSRVHPRAIWAAFLAPATGIGIVVIGLVIVLGTGGAADEGTVQAGVLYAGLALTLVGSVVFATLTVSTGALSRVAASTIVVGVLPTVLGLFGGITAIWLVVGGIIFGLGWIGLGLDAIRRDRRPRSADPAAG